jgi:ATP-dependent helicase YprA (DUF1998 family)
VLLYKASGLDAIVTLKVRVSTSQATVTKLEWLHAPKYAEKLGQTTVAWSPRPEKSAGKRDQEANERATRVVPPSRDTKRLLEGIGTPRKTPFKPDPFQLEALAALEYEDVLVTAPTGSGKTWIARRGNPQASR